MSLPAEQLHQQSLDILAKLASLHKTEEHIETSHLAMLASPPCIVTCPFCGQIDCNENCNRNRGNENTANAITGGNAVDRTYMVSIGKSTAGQMRPNTGTKKVSANTMSKKRNDLTTTPQKKDPPEMEPMTPETNLKMLVSAASGLEPALPKFTNVVETVSPEPTSGLDPAVPKSASVAETSLLEPPSGLDPAVPKSVNVSGTVLHKSTSCFDPAQVTSASVLQTALHKSSSRLEHSSLSTKSAGGPVSTVSTKVRTGSAVTIVPPRLDHVLETINMMPLLPKALSCLGRTLLPKEDAAVYDADSETTEDGVDAKTKTEKLTGRKEKSLGLLCKKFMSIYPEFSPEGTIIMLDDVVTSLSIGRRRVYDIVNVLESMEMMVRQAKNKYLWFGKSRLPDTLAKLKALALRVYGENFSNMAKRVCGPNVRVKPGDPVASACFILPKNIQPTKLMNMTTSELAKGNLDSMRSETPSGGSQNNSSLGVDDFTHLMMDSIISYDLGRRDGNRSLGILCQKFIMLFMVAENNVVSLDRAAKLLITEPEEGAGKYKTKVRRLYDIANILTSIGFLEKCVSFEERSKKAAYKWIGLDLKSINCEEEAGKAFLSQEYSLTRHSLLTQGVRDCYDALGNPKSRTRVLGTRSSSAQNLSTMSKSSAAQNIPEQVRKFNLRAMSDTMVFNDKENADPEKQDGFEIDSLETENKNKTLAPIDENVAKVASKSSAESPNQSLFKEKLRLLQKEFPDKLSSESLADLVSFIKANPPPKAAISPSASPAPSPAPSRRRLSSELDSQIDDRTTKKVRPEPVTSSGMEDILSPMNTSSPVPLSLFASSNAGAKGVLKNKSENSRGSTKLQPPAFMTIPAMVKPVATADSKAAQNISMLLSPISSQVTLPKSGLYQIIPVQSRSALVERQLESPVPSPGNKRNILAFSGNIGTLLAKSSPKAAAEASKLMEKPVSMRQAATMVSPSVAISPTPASLKQFTATVSPTPASLKQFTDSPINLQQLATDGYQGFFTPPHVVQKNSIKPPANPITFPKMTPETPKLTPETPTSLGLSRAVLTNVTRKLSLQKENAM